MHREERISRPFNKLIIARKILRESCCVIAVVAIVQTTVIVSYTNTTGAGEYVELKKY